MGTGRLAWSLAPALVRAGYAITAVSSHSVEGSVPLARALGPSTRSVTNAKDVLDTAELVFLTVPDAIIRPVADSLPWQPRHLAVHCSGALSLDALSAAAAAGAETGTFHPIQSFPSRRPEPERFTNIYCGIEATGSLESLLDHITRALGAHSLSLAGVNRSLYHAAAVFASNDVIALMSAASRTWALAGLPPDVARVALAPLLTASAVNIAALDLASALTGPIARGDTGTIRAHLDALSAEPELRDLYRQLGVELLRVAAHGRTTRQELIDLLTDPPAR